MLHAATRRRGPFSGAMRTSSRHRRMTEFGPTAVTGRIEIPRSHRTRAHLKAALGMARFAGFSVTLFRGVFSYSFYMALMFAFGAKRTSQRGREHVDVEPT